MMFILLTGGRYEVRPDEGLLILNVNKEMDDGQYTCRAEVAEDGRMDQRVIDVDVHSKSTHSRQSVFMLLFFYLAMES